MRRKSWHAGIQPRGYLEIALRVDVGVECFVIGPSVQRRRAVRLVQVAHSTFHEPDVPFSEVAQPGLHSLAALEVSAGVAEYCRAFHRDQGGRSVRGKQLDRLMEQRSEEHTSELQSQFHLV